MHAVIVRSSAVFLLALAVAVSGTAQNKKKKKKDAEDEITQTLPVLKDPPQAVSAETAKLVFHVSPLSPKGLLTQQVKDGLKALIQENHGASIVKLRAFVAGSGDMRRVQQIVSEVFTEHKAPLPAVSTIQVGALPLLWPGVTVKYSGTLAGRKLFEPDAVMEP